MGMRLGMGGATAKCRKSARTDFLMPSLVLGSLHPGFLLQNCMNVPLTTVPLSQFSN